MYKNSLLSIGRRDRIHALIDMRGYKICAEIGVEYGDFSEYILKSNIEKLYLIDCWKSQLNYNDMCNRDQEKQDEIYSKVVERFRHDGRVSIVRDFSLDACRSFSDKYFDFVYLDSDHSYDHVKMETRKWYKKVKDGGILAGHDYVDGIINGTEFGVKKAVDEFAREKGKLVFVLDEQFPSWFIIK